MPDKHAVLSASSSHRWLECPPSALINAQTDESPGEYARQGTDAHSLCEYKLRKALGEDVVYPELTYFDEEMEECTDSYVQFVMEKAKNAKVLVEQRLDFSKWVPDGFGTGDCIIVSEGRLSVVDFKYGVGVLVSAENNPQMMLYALGALDMFDGIYDISMTIFQPRRENISTFEISKDRLLEWAENTLKPTAELAAKGKGEFKAGAHCQFCKIKSECRKRAEYNLELAKYDFEMPDTLDDYEIEGILSKSDEFVSWINDVKQYALNKAIKGKRWTDFKLVEGRSNRRYTDEKAVADTVLKAGYDPYEHKVLGVTAMSKLLGKTKFQNLLGGLVEKPKGKLTLVNRTDKRPEVNRDFREEF
ncbi:MAG: DUF2800 domain-containing protein [Oscillospiraceae bacterium]